MNKLLGILLMLVLVAAVTGCDGLRRYDARLVRADSLMQPDPDSALAIVSAIDSLAGDANLAYRDLLLTQARYKCYQDITAGDDSAITRAMAWYRAHGGEREKLTRAYLYKGAVMQELGHVDSAMYYYKTAELTADPKDYANLGQINTRIAALYRRYYADQQICYDKYRQALSYYQLIDNKSLQLNSMLNMASCSGIMHRDDAEKLFNQASQLAVELNDSLCYYQCQELLCRQLSYEGKSVTRAKQIAMHCLNDYRDFVNHDLLLDLADIYAYSGMPDSARYYLDLVAENASMNNLEQVKTRKYLILSNISKSEGDIALSAHYDMLSHQVSDSSSNNSFRYQIQEIENSFNNRQFDSNQSNLKRLRWLIIAISLIAILLIISLIAAYLRRVYRTKAILKELENIQPNHYDELLNRLDEKSAVVERLTTNMVALLKICSNHGFLNSTTKLAQQIKETIVDVADDDFWNELRFYLDKEHDNIISKIAENPGIKKRDLKFIELLCCGFSNVEIAIILGYAPKYVSRKRKILAQKLGTDQPLKDHLNRLMIPEVSEGGYRKQ